MNAMRIALYSTMAAAAVFPLVMMVLRTAGS
jgi:hypothetical protein